MYWLYLTELEFTSCSAQVPMQDLLRLPFPVQ